MSPIALTGHCPRCESDLEVRYSHRNGQNFIGCTAYPECKFTHPYDRALEQLGERIAELEREIDALPTHRRRPLPKNWRVIG